VGACNILYGKYPVESTPFKNNLKSNTSSIILAETIPTLIEYKSAVPAAGGEDGYEQSPKGLLTFVKKSQTFDFLEISPSEIGLITEIEIN
jgi:hypothetical protein